ncbi:MAG: aminotransferase [Prevotellaceae bacterium]|nr:aminotransferase [Prevotellaceae bacterium]
MKDGIIIQARTGSTRLPGKILLPFYEGACIIDLLTARIKHSCPGKTVVLATTPRPGDDVLEEAARKAGAACFRGDEENVLGRFIGAAEAFGIDRFIRVCSDNPFLQTDSFEALFKAHDASRADYVSFAFADGLPVIKSHLGLFAELTTTDALRRVAAATREKLALEHVTIYLYTHPEAYKLHLLPLPAALEGRQDLRFTLDTKDDFTLLQTLYAAYREGGEHTLPALLRLVEASPECRAAMRRNIAHNSK